MTITIDRAGRVVIPKEIRERLNLSPGSELELELDGEAINLKAVTSETKLVERHGVFVFDSNQNSDIDIAEFINQQRENRASSMDKRLYTYNLGHFNRLNPVDVSISSP